MKQIMILYIAIGYAYTITSLLHSDQFSHYKSVVEALDYKKNSAKKQLIKVINKDYPHLVINKLCFYGQGYCNVLFKVNNNLLFRFARRSTAARRILQSAALLKYLKNKVPLEIPHICYTGKKYIYIGYKKIEGCLWQPLNTLSEKEKETLAIDLAQFLAALHTEAVKRKACALNIRKHFFLSYAAHIATLLKNKEETKDIAYLANAIADTYTIPSLESTDVGLVHGDFHGGNMVFNKAAKSIEGVFDFDLMHIGDIHEDFIWLYKRSFSEPAFFDTLVKNYEKYSGKKLCLRTIQLATLLMELQNAALFTSKSSANYRKTTYNNIELLKHKLQF